jgi:hypothetical protein
MSLDPILWDILGISENASEPLSFRARGAFTCPGLPIFDGSFDQTSLTSADAAMALSAIIKDNEVLVKDILSRSSFSSLVAQPPNYRENGAYGETLVTSLFNDRDYDAAAKIAAAYESGELKSCTGFQVNGASFYRLALDWLEAKKILTKFTL